MFGGLSLSYELQSLNKSGKRSFGAARKWPAVCGALMIFLLQDDVGI